MISVIMWVIKFFNSGSGVIFLYTVRIKNLK